MTEHDEKESNENWIAKKWYATKESIGEDFEETRRCMLTSYHSYIQTHAGYIIALIIGFSAIISTFESFIESTIGTVVFIILLLSIIGASAFMTLRIFYWTIYANITLGLPIDRAIELFNSSNKTYFNKPPNTIIIQKAIDGSIDNLRKDYFCWHKKENKKNLSEAAKGQLFTQHKIFAVWFSQTQAEKHSIEIFGCLFGIIAFTILGTENFKEYFVFTFLASLLVISIVGIVYFCKKLKKDWGNFKTD